MQATISFTQITTTASLFSILQSFFHTAAHRAFQKGDIYITYVVFLSNIFKQNLTIRKQLDKSRFKFTLQENWSFLECWSLQKCQCHKRQNVIGE